MSENDGNQDLDGKTEEEPLYAAREHDTRFDPDAYLNGFYKTANEDEAMQIVLFFLPGIIYRLPSEIPTLLDLGSGPTIYIPILMRNRCERIYVSDYAEANRNHLRSWMLGENKFDWNEICRWIASIEASNEHPSQMLALARSKTQAVLEVNVHREKAIRAIDYCKGGQAGEEEIPESFDVVTTVFCLEYASETVDEYKRAVKSATSLIKAGGYLVQGGVLHANEYAFGGRRFKCHHLTMEHIMESLKENDMCAQEKSGNFKIICHDDIFLLVSKKKEK